MDLLNNLNVVVGVIVGLFGIGGYIIGIAAYLKNKVFTIQQQQPVSPSVQTPPTAQYKILSRLDWMELLWRGLVDTASAKEYTGCIAPIMTAFFGSLFVLFVLAFTNNTFIIVAGETFFLMLLMTFMILFYIYFVGRRVEERVKEKTEELNRTAVKRPVASRRSGQSQINIP